MLRVTIELIPYGSGEPEHLGTAIISNNGTGTLLTGNYDVTLSMFNDPEKAWKQKKNAVKGFDRLKRGPWDLLYLCLKELVGKRN